MTAQLYHGPGAFQTALDGAGLKGRLLHEPFVFGSGGEIEAARDFVSLMLSPPIGLGVGVLLAGPMDLASSRSADALLKSIEEHSAYVWPFLWAHDLGGVPGTIRSRCHLIWCPPTGHDAEVSEEVEGLAREILSAALGGRVYELPVLLGKGTWGGRQPLLEEMFVAMSGDLENPQVLQLWERLRPVAQWRNPTMVEVLSGLLGS